MSEKSPHRKAVAGTFCVNKSTKMFLICKAGTGNDAAVNEEDEEEQHSATAPPPNRQGGHKHITIHQWAAYYLQIRDPSPDEVCLFDVHHSGCCTYF